MPVYVDPSKSRNAEPGPLAEPLRAGLEASICGVGVLEKGTQHSLRTPPCIWTLQGPLRRNRHISVSLGQELRSKPFQALAYCAATVIGLVALAALWVLLAHALSRFQYLDKIVEKRTFLLAHLGAGLALWALLLMVLINVFPGMSDLPFTSVGLLYLGAPALLPYAHCLYLIRTFHIKVQCSSAYPGVEVKQPAQ